MRPRFRLRTLLVVPVIVAAACLWVTRPTIVANRFLSAMQAGDHAAADVLFADPEQAVQAKVREVVGNGTLDSIHCALVEPTWADWLRGRRIISMDIHFGVYNGPLRNTPKARLLISSMKKVQFEIVATPIHLKSPRRQN